MICKSYLQYYLIDFSNIFAGLPTTIVFALTSFVTTLPMPTIAFSPIEILFLIVALIPMKTLLWIVTNPPIIAPAGISTLCSI